MGTLPVKRLDLPVAMGLGLHASGQVSQDLFGLIYLEVGDMMAPRTTSARGRPRLHCGLQFSLQCVPRFLRETRKQHAGRALVHDGRGVSQHRPAL